MRFYSVRENQLSGTIPTDLFLLTGLGKHLCQGVSWHGRSSEFVLLPIFSFFSLKAYIDLSYNQFAGAPPDFASSSEYIGKTGWTSGHHMAGYI